MNLLFNAFQYAILFNDAAETPPATFEEDLVLLPYRLISTAVIVGLALAALFVLRKIFKKYYVHTEKDNKSIKKERITAARMLHSAIRFVVILMAVFAVLSTFGVNVTAGIAALGVAGAIGALAVQDLLKDFISGANIASEQYFAIGDVVEYENIIGTVTGLSMRSTKIKTLDGSTVTLQNHIISKIRIISEENKVLIPLPYELEREKAYALCETIAEKITELPEVKSCKTSGIQEFADSSISYALLFYCNPAKMLTTKRLTNVAVINELDRAGISIPYNKIEVFNMDAAK